MPGCTEVGGLLDAYVDETASPLEREWIELHAAACGRCRRALRERRCLRRRLRQLPRPAMPAPMKDHLLSAFRTHRPASASSPPRPAPLPQLFRPPDPATGVPADS